MTNFDLISVSLGLGQGSGSYYSSQRSLINRASGAIQRDENFNSFTCTLASGSAPQKTFPQSLAAKDKI
jgi:hypothetical protein